MLKKIEKKSSVTLGYLRVKKEILKRKKEFFIMFVIAILIGIGDSLQKLYLGKTIDALVSSENINIWNFEINNAYYYSSIFFILIFLDAFSTTYMWEMYAKKVSYSLYKTYLSEIYSKIVKYPTDFFKNKGLGKITYSSVNGADKIFDVVNIISNSFTVPILILSNLYFLFILSKEIFILSLIGFLFYVLIFFLTKNKNAKLSEINNEKRKDVTETMTEKLNLIFEVKKNNKEFIESKYFKDKKIGEQDKSFYDIINFVTKVSYIRDITYLFTMVGALFLSVFLYKKGSVTVGQIASINMYVMFLSWNYAWIVREFDDLIQKFTIIGDTEKLLLHTPENYEEGKIKKEVEGEIEFKNVSFNYKEEDNEKAKKYKNKKGKRFSLKNLNLKIKKGSKIAFVGESGGGKSTTIELIGGFYFPTKGEVLVDEIPTKKWNLNSLRTSIAYVSQDIAIFNTTIGQNIAYGALKEVSDEEIKEAAKLAHISEYIESLEDKYNTKVGEKGLKLSGGQKQRIAIARAILRNPKILILDEPTSALDIKSETYITESLKELMKGRTTIIIAHRISTVRNSDKIYVFKHGEIIEEGTYQELEEKNGEFKKMIELNKGLR